MCRACDFLAVVLVGQYPTQGSPMVVAMRSYCQRTGKQYREARAPLYRLRSALSRLWQEHPPVLGLRRHATSPPVGIVTITELPMDWLLARPSPLAQLA